MAEIAENLRKIRAEVDRIAQECGRLASDIRIVAVSKTFGVPAIREAIEAGQRDFGESYAAEFRSKTAEIDDVEVRWHFIGHLQSNKARLVVGPVSLIHSLDRISLASELQKRADASDTVVNALIEIHTTGEATKSGSDPAEVPQLVASLKPLDRIKVTGLMTMGPFSDDPEDARPCFRTLRELRDRLLQSGTFASGNGELSMGMSSDFGVAIQEGATILRIGTAIFGTRTTTRP